jgi:small multidrug resistance pump
MNTVTPYIFLAIAIFFGTTSNSFAKSAEGFTLLIPTIISAVTIILCMYSLSNVMKVIPIGITYASFAGLTIIATAVVGVVKYNQIPNFYTIIGLVLIIIGVLMVNLMNKFNI